MKLAHLILAAAAIGGTATAPAGAADPAQPPSDKFELRDGDRVVFLGNTLIEREQKYGYWELMLTTAWPDRNVTYRNLGWSGDTVWGESRAVFGTQADGFKALIEQVNAAEPTVIFVGYGNVEAFDGEKGLPRFIVGYNKLLDVLEATKARIIVLGPHYQNLQGPQVVDAAPYNRDVERYSGAIASIAKERAHLFLDSCRPMAPWLLSTDKKKNDSGNLTTTGLDLTAVGYSIYQVQVLMPALADSHQYVDTFDAKSARILFELLHAIVRKNELFFHRWRPQNETYLFGFRKHEQGNNAKEVFEFDPLIAAEEMKIAELRVKLAAVRKETQDAK